MSQIPQLPDDNQLRLEGIRALNAALGRTAALRFLSLIRREPTDYVNISKTVYDGQTVDEIFDRAKTGWQE